jgi:hypothetical protein
MHREIDQNILVINLHNARLAILTVMIVIETDRVEVNRVGSANLHISRWNQQSRQAVFGG